MAEIWFLSVKERKQMAPSFMETMTRNYVTKFLEQFISTGCIMWVILQFPLYPCLIPILIIIPEIMLQFLLYLLGCTLSMKSCVWYFWNQQFIRGRWQSFHFQRKHGKVFSYSSSESAQSPILLEGLDRHYWLVLIL